jgi:hypothetical protein
VRFELSGGTTWPNRYRVTVRTARGIERIYHAVTSGTGEKAVELAVAAHHRRHPDDAAEGVDVEDLGPVGQDQRGVLVLEGRDLVDRREF